MQITEIAEKQRTFFYSGATRSLEFRKNALRRLRKSIEQHEDALNEALRRDLNKSPSESYFCEIGLVYDEIRFHLKHLSRWMKEKKVPTPMAQFWSKSFLSPEPYGVALIMSPWNYPVQLCLSPLVGAISAGNCAVIKPSAYAPNVSQVIGTIISDAFPAEYISVIQGGREENTALLEQKFDYIFFTGSVSVGKLVMQAASKHLTPVSLELGGKSPVIVEESADLKLAARRIAFGKVLNAGQTCVAPDYLMIHKSVRDQFVFYYQQALEEFFPLGNYEEYPRMINEKHYQRVVNLMKGEKVLVGGEQDPKNLKIYPALLDLPEADRPIMQEEIFGPVLPMITYEDLDQVISYIRENPKPLALYLFTRNRKVERKILDSCSFGGGCINDTIVHLATPHMGFGGVGESGMGCYHGKYSFDTFSHERSILKKSYFPDLPMRYHPYTKKKDWLIKKFLK